MYCISSSNSRQKEENYTASEVKEEAQKIHRRGDNTQKYENEEWGGKNEERKEHNEKGRKD
jgi:hypothetical protein